MYLAIFASNAFGRRFPEPPGGCTKNPKSVENGVEYSYLENMLVMRAFDIF